MNPNNDITVTKIVEVYDLLKKGDKKSLHYIPNKMNPKLYKKVVFFLGIHNIKKNWDYYVKGLYKDDKKSLLKVWLAFNYLHPLIKEYIIKEHKDGKIKYRYYIHREMLLKLDEVTIKSMLVKDEGYKNLARKQKMDAAMEIMNCIIDDVIKNIEYHNSEIPF